jgi:hypothetical protein
VLSVAVKDNRRELIASCNRNGHRYAIALPDVDLRPDPATLRLVAAFRGGSVTEVPLNSYARGCVGRRAGGRRRLTGSDERVPRSVRPDRLVEPSPAGDASHDPPSSVAVEAPTVLADKDRPGEPLTNGEVDRPGSTWG